MSTPSGSNIISVEEAAHLHGTGTARFIDARWYMPNDARKAHAAYLQAHLPEAAFLDIDAVSRQSETHPHLMPTPQAVHAFLGQAGVRPQDTAIVYDDAGFFSAPRGWWMLKTAGHADVRVLDGGLAAWRNAGLPLESGEATPQPVEYQPLRAPDMQVVGREAVRQALKDASARVVDARPAERFAGLAPEPRPGLPSGHMPGAHNVPFATLLSAEGGMLPPQRLRERLAEAGLAPEDPVIASCGSGITACVVLLALEEAGWQGERRLYDGSWIDWASQPDAEIETSQGRG